MVSLRFAPCQDIQKQPSRARSTAGSRFNSKINFTQKLENPPWYAPPGVDPFAEMLMVYNQILGDYLSLEKPTNLLVATGLTQQACSALRYYYRLKEHAQFLEQVGIVFNDVLPRMTRDFLIEFDSAQDTHTALEKLKTFRAAKNGESIFGDIENRGTSIFLSLVYPHEIEADFVATYDTGEIKLGQWVVFSSINNGEHNPYGFAFFKGEVATFAPEKNAHVKNLYHTVMNFFQAA
jgi:hypothetical protein